MAHLITRKENVADVLVHVGEPPDGNPYHGSLVGDVRKKALRSFMANGDALGFTFWFGPACGGARKITRDEVDWRTSGLMSEAEAAAFDAAEVEEEGQTVDAPTLSIHAETGTACSPDAPCGTCKQRAAGAPVAGDNGDILREARRLAMADDLEDRDVARMTDVVLILHSALSDVRDIVFGAEGGSVLDRYMLIRDKLAFLKPTWK